MILLGALLVVILWTVTVVTGIRLLVPLRSVGHRSAVTFLASIFSAFTLTCNFAPVYRAVDRMLGGVNLAALLQHTCLILASFFAVQLLLRSIGSLGVLTNRLLIIVLGIALATQTIAFLSISRHPTTTDLMLVAHREPAAFIFSMSHFLFFGFASAIALQVGIQLTRTHAGAAANLSAAAMIVAGAAGVVNVAVVVVRDDSRLNGDMTLEWLDPAFRALILTVAFCFCIGLSVPAIAGAARRHRIARVLGILERALARSDFRGWEPAHSSNVDDPKAIPDALSILNETVIRLRDGQQFEKGTELSADELSALATAERILQGR